MGHPHGYDEGKTERVMGQTIEYKGYDGSVLYSAEDRLLHGRILGIRDMVLYDGSSIREIEKNFDRI